MDDHGADSVIETALGPRLPQPRLSREQVVGGQHEWSPREHVCVEPLHGEPLEMDDVCVARGPEQPRHPRRVSGELAQRSNRGPWRAEAAPVEQLAHAVAVGRREVAVQEAAGDELDVHAEVAQGGAERVVVRGRVRGGVDDLGSHQRTRRAPGQDA